MQQQSPLLTVGRHGQRADLQLHQPLGGKRDHVAKDIRVGGDLHQRARLANKSVAVPFVGMTAACLAIAEILRLLHGGPKFSNLKLCLGRVTERPALTTNAYQVPELIGIQSVPARIRA
jgi:hypothetical protein